MKDFASLFAQTKIVVLGDVILDSYILGEVSRISPEAPVPIVRVNRRATSLGGSGNVALNLRGLGCAVSLLSIRGADASGERIRDLLREKGIQDHVLVDTKHITTTKTRIIGQNQQLVRLDEENMWSDPENYREQLLRVLTHELADAGIVILSDYHKGVLNGAFTQAAIQACKMRGVRVFIDPKRRNWERYQGATCITPNTSELEEIYGQPANTEEELLRAIRTIKKQFEIEWFLATRGAEGMCLLGPDDSPLFITASSSEVYDVSGAGDTVISTLAACVAAGFSFKDAAPISNLAAGVVVRKIGAQPITVGELETEFRIAHQGARGGSIAKITSLEAAHLQVKAWQSVGQRVVLTFGSFDLLHPGHTYFLNEARKAGKRLVVALRSDDEIRRLKGDNRPILRQQDRASVLSALGCVDLIISCASDENAGVVARAVAPEVMVMDSEMLPDLESLRQIIESQGGKTESIHPLPGYNTSEIVSHINDV